MQFIPLIVIFALMYAVLILPQQRRAREHKAVLQSLEVGDEVFMNSGIHGFLADIQGDIVWIEVAENVELKITRSSIAGKVAVPSQDDDDADDTDDVKDS